MARLLHRGAALLAAYAIALQALLAGVVPAAPASLDPLAVLCTSGPASDDGAPPSRHDATCPACPIACGGGATALVPAHGAVSPLTLAEASGESVFSAQALPPFPKYRLRASRAPPSGA